MALDSSDNADTSTSQPGRTQAFATGKLLKRMLLNNMTQYFNYPRFALIRGWQGEVIIGIRIEPDGYISRTRLVNSSGYGTLDLAALEGARKVKSLPNAVALLNGQPFDLQLPVIYRLQDG
ncbi:MAG: energy transducer TonB [Acidiferrobacterales bacterium]